MADEKPVEPDFSGERLLFGVFTNAAGDRTDVDVAFSPRDGLSAGDHGSIIGHALHVVIHETLESGHGSEAAEILAGVLAEVASLPLNRTARARLAEILLHPTARCEGHEH